MHKKEHGEKSKTSLSGKDMKEPTKNFAGIKSELIYKGGEHKFIHDMIKESKKFSQNCLWFSTLVSKKSNLKGIYKALKKIEVLQVKTIPMGTSNKSSHVIAWTFLSKDEQKKWRETKWNN